MEKLTSLLNLQAQTFADIETRMVWCLVFILGTRATRLVESNDELFELQAVHVLVKQGDKSVCLLHREVGRFLEDLDLASQGLDALVDHFFVLVGVGVFILARSTIGCLDVDYLFVGGDNVVEHVEARVDTS